MRPELFQSGATRGLFDYDAANGMRGLPAGATLTGSPARKATCSSWNSTDAFRQIDPSGVVTTLAGTVKAGGKDGPPLDATFAEPTGIAIGPTGDIFVLETGAHRIRKISGGRVTTLHHGLPPTP